MREKEREREREEERESEGFVDSWYTFCKEEMFKY